MSILVLLFNSVYIHDLPARKNDNKSILFIIMKYASKKYSKN
jgi:hypothetical protein